MEKVIKFIIDQKYYEKIREIIILPFVNWIADFDAGKSENLISISLWCQAEDQDVCQKIERMLTKKRIPFKEEVGILK